MIDEELSRTLRPEENPDLVGHEAAEHLLWQAWRYGQLAHAWLIGGPGGIGKATLACRFARFVLAAGATSAGQGVGQEAATLYMPPDHPTFRRTAARGHADFRIVERGCNESGRHRTQIVVEDIRDVGRFLTLTAAEGSWRTVVIDGAEIMNDSASNALLKVLEEPPPRSLLLLVSHNPGRLLPTIRSRCRLLTLRPLHEQQVGTLLGRLRPFLASTEARAVTRLAEGSIGWALELADNNGVALYQTILDLFTDTPHLQEPALHAFSDLFVTRTEGRSFAACGELLKTWLVRVVRRGVTGQPIAEVVPGEEILAYRLTTVVKLDRWVEVWGKISHLFSQVESLNLDRKQVILSALIAIERVARP